MYNARSDREIATWLRGNGFDIAVDLKGHTEGSRPGILAHRPCPVQVNYLGYPGTIGAPWLDYILGDATALAVPASALLQREDRPPAALPIRSMISTRHIAETPARSEAGLPEGSFCFLLLQRGLEDHACDIRCLDAIAACAAGRSALAAG